MLSPRRKLIYLFYHRHHPHCNRLKLLTSSGLCPITIALIFLLLLLVLLRLVGMITEDKAMEDGNEGEYLAKTLTQEPLQDVDNFWTRISDSLHVYSAHLDSRNKGNANLTLIRIIGIKRVPSMKSIIRRNPMEWLRIKDETYFGNKYFCKVFISRNKVRGDGNDMSEPSTLKVLQGDIITYKIIEEGVKAFASCFVNCYINSTKLNKIIGQESADIFIALYPLNVSNYPDKLIRVEMEMNIQAKVSLGARTLGLCVRPLFGPMDDLAKVAEFVTYYNGMGVTTMSFYDLSMSPRVRKYLKDLRKFGGISVTLRRWNLPTGNTSELWDYGSLAALNDCLYRSMRDSHVIFVDIDEFIVPQMGKHKDLQDVINFHEIASPNFHQLLIRNTFFCQEFCPTNMKNSFSIRTCTIRTKRIWNVLIRSKFIVKPRKVISVGHHWVTKFVDQVDSRFVTNSIEARKDVALMNHYRECESISDRKHPILNRLTVLDESILRFLR